MKPNKLRVGTYNIRNVTDHYEKRLPLLINTFKTMNCDVIGFQEVSFFNNNQLKDLYKDDEYKEFLSPCQLNYKNSNDVLDDKFNIDGNAILLKNEILQTCGDLSHRILHLSPVRTAHMLSFKLNMITVNIINCHLHHVIDHEVIRMHQVNYLVKWIETNVSDDSVTILLGDFNFLPTSESYEFILKSGYTSAYSNIYGQEPEKTFHNKMDAPFKDIDPDGTFDYLFIKNSFNSLDVILEKVEIYGTEESTVDNGIFASDHYSLVLDVYFEAKSNL